MAVADREKDSIFRIEIVTLDPDRDLSAKNSRTVYSLVWTAKTLHATPVNMYLSNYVGVCGSERVKECAASLAAETDTWVARVRGWLLDAIDNGK